MPGRAEINIVEYTVVINGQERKIQVPWITKCRYKDGERLPSFALPEEERGILPISSSVKDIRDNRDPEQVWNEILVKRDLELPFDGNGKA